MSDNRPFAGGQGGQGEALTLFRRLSSSTVASSFQLQSRDQFGGQVYLRSNTTLDDLSTQLGYSAIASGNRSVAVGAFAYAREDSSVSMGLYALAMGSSAIAIGEQTKASVYRSLAVGSRANALGVHSISIGALSLVSGYRGIAVGNEARASGSNGIAIGFNTVASGSVSLAIGSQNTASGGFSTGIGGTASALGATAIGSGSAASAQYSTAVGYGAEATLANQTSFGDPTDALAFTNKFRIVQESSGQQFTILALTELTTIAAAAFTDTTIQIPANAVVFGVSVRVTVAIPTAATFDVGVAGATTRYATGVSVAANTTYPGTDDATRAYLAAVAVRITPSAVPANTNGRVRVTIAYYTITPPTS